MTSKTPSVPNYARNRREAKQEKSLPGMQNSVWRACLPAAATTETTGVGASVVVTAAAATTATTTTPTTTATTTATPAATTTAATAVADHLSETGVDLLLSLGEDGDKITGLLSICGKED